jgi:hypothetical protein
VYVTNNLSSGASASWTKLSDPPRTERHPAVIAVLRDGSVVCSYSGRRNAAGAFTASSGVFVYNPASQQWRDATDANMQYWTRDIVIDAFDTTQNTWYACVYSGWGGAANDKGGLYRTTNRGQNWARLTSTSDILSVPSCVINPANRDQMFVTSEINGLWYTANLSAATPTFTQVSGYPFSHPQRVFFNPYHADAVWVASFGNGMRVASMSGSAVVSRPFRSAPRLGIDTKAGGAVFDLRGARVSSASRVELARGVYCISGKAAGQGAASRLLVR